ncbi:CE1759 family FMN reductase [Arsenicicoccus piscis]|uniref:NADPH-dependent FMN reductase-like domain-containing protein n=1 Tax=Arsenicicoccus piscis TaxID=673954 RepID=A0ABQ6HNV3_9MICO|nr:CE1759 family FMN reductase [Arsenicicoccus piscis]GMA20041.1 hypothetical protein GCM10025862_20620 [Arsenicicoccus piscis]
MTRAQELLASADAVIAVTPVFSASYSGLFKMFFDVLEPGTLDGTPVLVAATAGTPRHSLVLEHALRPLFSYLHAVVVPTAVFAATEDFGGTSELGPRVARAAAELSALMVAETGAVGGFAAVPGVDSARSGGRSGGRSGSRAGAGAGAGRAAVTPFAELLRGHSG